MILIVIPARIGSTRLARKPLLKIGEYPMLWWTWQRAKKSKFANKVIIATDSQEIVDEMSLYGAECFMTGECNSGSDRVFEAAKAFNPEIVVNLQGDEPLMTADIIDGTIQVLLNNSKAQISTPVLPFKCDEDKLSPNHVKAVLNSENKALYFSRANLANSYLHLGLYAFRFSALKIFCNLPVSDLEKAERLEQLRAFDREDLNIFAYKTQSEHEIFGVDTEKDFEQARKILYNCKSL